MRWSNGLSPGSGAGIEQATLAAGGHGHAHGVGDALTQGSGRDLDARGVVVLRVAGVWLPHVRRLLRSSSVIG